MAHPTDTIPTIGPLAPLDMVNRINDWVTSLRESWQGPTPPASPVEGQIWLDTSTAVGKRVFMRIDGAWSLLLSAVGPWITDFDAATADGFYRFGGGALNSPFPGNSGTVIISSRGGAATQTAMLQTLNEANLLHVRAWLGGSSFTPWRRQYTQADIVGVVARSGGVPIGAAFESDSLSAGSYTRLADGSQTCRATRTFTRDDTTRLHTLWTFPRAFINNDYQLSPCLRSLSATPTRTQLSQFSYGDTATATQLRVLLYRAEGAPSFAAGDTAQVDLTVNGRWAS